MVALVLKYRFPTIDLLSAVRVEDDGRGARLRVWDDRLGPTPSDDDITRWSEDPAFLDWVNQPQLTDSDKAAVVTLRVALKTAGLPLPSDKDILQALRAEVPPTDKEAAALLDEDDV